MKRIFVKIKCLLNTFKTILENSTETDRNINYKLDIIICSITI